MLDKLKIELIYEICRYLSIKDIIHLLKTNKDINRKMKSDTFWNLLYIDRYHEPPTFKGITSFKRRHIEDLLNKVCHNLEELDTKEDTFTVSRSRFVNPKKRCGIM